MIGRFQVCVFFICVVFRGRKLTFAQSPHPNNHGGHDSEGTHVDLPNQHGNMLPFPVIHRHTVDQHTGIGPRTRPQQSPSLVHPNGGGVHVDAPGQHGNNLPYPVIHRPQAAPNELLGHSHNQVNPAIHRSPTGHASGNYVPGEIHVDLPNQHGNNSPHPVIHRVSVEGHHGFAQEHEHVPGEIHVDLPNQHGNNSPHPVIHRVGVEDHHVHVPGEIHVDLPNQHGNDRPHPVIHRVGLEDQHRLPRGHEHVPGEIHVDLPNQHGNISPHPVIHRVGNQHAVAHDPRGKVSVPSVPPELVKNTHGLQGIGTHIDRPGQHGNLSPFPIVHRPNPSGSVIGTHHEKTIHHDRLLPVPVVHRSSSHESIIASPLGQHESVLAAPLSTQGHMKGQTGSFRVHSSLHGRNANYDPTAVHIGHDQPTLGLYGDTALDGMSRVFETTRLHSGPLGSLTPSLRADLLHDPKVIGGLPTFLAHSRRLHRLPFRHGGLSRLIPRPGIGFHTRFIPHSLSMPEYLGGLNPGIPRLGSSVTLSPPFIGKDRLLARSQQSARRNYSLNFLPDAMHKEKGRRKAEKKHQKKTQKAIKKQIKERNKDAKKIAKKKSKAIKKIRKLKLKKGKGKPGKRMKKKKKIKKNKG